MESLVKCGLLHMRTVAMEWLMPSRKEVPASLDGYVVLFVPFLKRGLVMPPH
jgi:hypothetical protein